MYPLFIPISFSLSRSLSLSISLASLSISLASRSLSLTPSLSLSLSLSFSLSLSLSLSFSHCTDNLFICCAYIQTFDCAWIQIIKRNSHQGFIHPSSTVSQICLSQMQRTQSLIEIGPDKLKLNFLLTSFIVFFLRTLFHSNFCYLSLHSFRVLFPFFPQLESKISFFPVLTKKYLFKHIYNNVARPDKYECLSVFKPVPFTLAGWSTQTTFEEDISRTLLTKIRRSCYTSYWIKC